MVKQKNTTTKHANKMLKATLIIPASNTTIEQTHTVQRKVVNSMGYISNVVIEQGSIYRPDYSYPTVEEQIAMQIEELFLRLIDIRNGNYGVLALERTGCQYNLKDIEYASPKFFFDENDVITAIAMKTRKLQKLQTSGKNEITSSQEEDDNYIPGQIAVWELIWIEVFFKVVILSAA